MFGLWVVLFLVCVSPVCAEERFACSSDEECSLSGKCVNKSCVCYPTWTSNNCSVLNLLPAAVQNGYKRGNISSWGGNMIRGKDGKYHLFVSEMVNNCGLSYWFPNSQIVRAVSDEPLGPYIFQEVVLPPFHHNPTIRQAPDGTYLLYYIGAIYNGTLENCTNTPNQTYSTSVNAPNPYKGLIGIAYSASLFGPWKTIAPILEGQSGQWDEWISNPSPLIFSNGTVLLAYRGKSSKERIGLAWAPSWKGPYKRLTNNPIFKSNIYNEDPFLWQNPSDGTFHMLMHYMNEPHVPEVLGRYGFSRNAINWTFSPAPAYTSIIQFQDNTTVTFASRERPQLYFDESGQPAYFISGVVDPRICQDCSYTFIQRVNVGK